MCIYYPLCFRKDIAGVKALIDSGNKFNTITSEYTLKLGFQVYYTNIGAQKIDSSILKMFGMVLASFQVMNKLGRARFF